jgi:hypothetical protein
MRRRHERAVLRNWRTKNGEWRIENGTRNSRCHELCRRTWLPLLGTQGGRARLPPGTHTRTGLGTVGHSRPSISSTPAFLPFEALQGLQQLPFQKYSRGVVCSQDTVMRVWRLFEPAVGARWDGATGQLASCSLTRSGWLTRPIHSFVFWLTQTNKQTSIEEIGSSTAWQGIR